MIGIILCGHGNFAEGMYSAVNLIAGKQDKFVLVPFLEGTSTQELYTSLENGISSLGDCSGVVIFTDIAGGTPFTQGCLLSNKHNNVKVIAGTNLSSLLSVVFERNLELGQFVLVALEGGFEGIKQFHKEEKKENVVGVDIDKEGI